MKRFILVVAFTFFSGLCLAQASVDSKKYCGSGLTEKIVPDNFMGCKFSDACKAHDVCYGGCDPGGKRYGSDYCKKSEASLERMKTKLICDAALGKTIAKINEGNATCKVFGGLYSAAVIIAGQGPFNGRQISEDQLRALVESSKSAYEVERKILNLYNLDEKGLVDLSQIKVSKETITLSSLSQRERAIVIGSDELMKMKKEDIAETVRQKFQGK